MIIEELLKRAQIYNYIYKHLSHCSPIEKQDSNITISKHSHYQPKSTYHTSKKFTDNDKWVAEYDLSTRNPKWVYETLRRPNTSATSSSSSSDIANRKKSKFFADQNIPNHFKIHPNDYNNWGYDRGHMTPAADFTQSQDMMDSTFSMVNICPQSPELNKGFWAKLEGVVRKLLHHEFDEMVIVTGPVFAPTLVNGRWVYAHSTIGTFPKLIKVPTHFFKIILGRRFLPVPSSGSTRVNGPKSTSSISTLDGSEMQYEQVAIAAVLVPNDAASSDIPLQSYLISLDQLEQLVGVMFFESVLSETSRKLLDEAVPDKRKDLSIVLDPVSQAYGSLLAIEPKSKSKSTSRRKNNQSNSNGDSDDDDDIRKNIIDKPGVVHLCQLVDCRSSLQALLASSSTN